MIRDLLVTTPEGWPVPPVVPLVVLVAWVLYPHVRRWLRPETVTRAPCGAWYGTHRDGSPCSCAFGHGHMTRHAARVCAARRGGRGPVYLDARDVKALW